jgi:hypothetical protein
MWFRRKDEAALSGLRQGLAASRAVAAQTLRAVSGRECSMQMLVQKETLEDGGTGFCGSVPKVTVCAVVDPPFL